MPSQDRQKKNSSSRLPSLDSLHSARISIRAFFLSPAPVGPRKPAFTLIYRFVTFLLHPFTVKLVQCRSIINFPTDERTLAIWKRRRTALLVGLTSLLLVVLAFLQNRWVNELSEFQLDQMERTLQASTRALSRDFSREFTRMRRTFYVGRTRSVEAEIIGDYQDWTDSFKFPHLIGDVYWIDHDPNANEAIGSNRVRRVDIEAGLLEPVEWPAALERIHRELSSADPQSFQDRGDRARFARGLTGPVGDHLFGLVVSQERESYASWAVALLRNDVLINEFIPFDVEEYFGPDETRDYDVWIVDEADETNVIYASNSALPTAALASPDIRRGLGDDSPDWVILAKHRSGSLQVVIDEYRTRNLSMSFGVVIVLGLSFAFLVVATRRAQSLAESQLEFVAGVSHELRTPIAGISSLSQNLADGVVGSLDQAARYGECINNESHRLADMVEGVLHFSAIRSGQYRYESQSIDLASVVDEELDLLDPAMVSQFALKREVDPEVPAVIGDEQALRSLVQNLVSNSMKFCEAGDEISVTLRPAAARAGIVELRVVDNGHGIERADIPHIFKPFYRGQNARDHQVGGVRTGAEPR